MRGAILRLIYVVMIGAACNLGAAPAQPTRIPPTPTVFAGAANPPEVTILSPQNGAQFPVNQPLFVEARATSPEGVTRIQLFANGSPVKTVSSTSPAGDTTFTATLDFTPRAVGPVNLRVQAFRGVVASAPADLQIVVVNQAAQPTPLPLPGGGGGSAGGGGGGLVIPPDGVCRIVTNSGVNLRSTPTTTQNNILTTLPASTLAPVIARLPDNSWWKVSVGSRIGWVSNTVVTITGNCFNVPIEQAATPTPNIPPPTPAPTLTPFVPTNTPAIPAATVPPPLPDLVVTSIFARTPLTLSGGSVTETFSVTVTNAGLGPAGAFNATIRIDNGAPLDLGAVSGLQQGQSVVLQRQLTFSGPGTYNIRVDVDPNNQVPEISEVNNRGDITIVVTN
ncbi:CARDB domain-containing protein [Aggregatilineales bacterium SYSU G02658]